MPPQMWRSRSGWRHPGRHRPVGGAGFPSPSRGAPRQQAVILTDRELPVLRFLPSHLTNAEIARECFMSVNTVKAHLTNIYAKLGVSTRAETVERARLLGLGGYPGDLTDPGIGSRYRCRQRRVVTVRRCQSLPGC